MGLNNENIYNEMEPKEELLKLYDKMSLFILREIKNNNVDPLEVAHESGLSSDKMLEVLCNNSKGDYLAFREMDVSIKKLVKERNIRLEGELKSAINQKNELKR